MNVYSFLVDGHLVSVDAEDALFVGGATWYVTRNYVRRLKGGRPFLHRLLLGALSDEVVDHIDGNPLNNTRRNLRICTHAENMRNRKMHANNASGLKGIYPFRGKWCAQIRVDGRKLFLGTHDNKEDAYAAYCNAAKAAHGEFARFA